jgi:hypothetical protein
MTSQVAKMYYTVEKKQQFILYLHSSCEWQKARIVSLSLSRENGVQYVLSPQQILAEEKNRSQILNKGIRFQKEHMHLYIVKNRYE